MKKIIVFGILALFTSTAIASEFYDRYQQQQRAQIEQQFQRIDQNYAESAVRVAAYMNAFAARHGGFSVSPQQSERNSAYSSSAGFTFTTADGLACSAWDRCGKRGGAGISCIDGNLHSTNYGPKSCRF